jgi:simple sugar transport system permease protein
MDNLNLIPLIILSIRAGTAIIYATIGEILTERSGIMNLGIEGIMSVGAVIGFAGAFYSHSVWVGVLFAVIAGGLFASIHAVLCNVFRVNQTVAGLALAITGVGLANLIGQRGGVNGTALVGQIGPQFAVVEIPWLSQIPLIGPVIFNQDPLVYLMFILVVACWILLYRTSPGLRLRAIGESPRTADSLGINVIKLRYIYTIIGGMLMGLGGAHISLSYSPGWSDNMIAGRGWIAVALVILRCGIQSELFLALYCLAACLQFNIIFNQLVLEFLLHF